MTTRRVVTGNNAEGKSYFVHDGPTPGGLNFGMSVFDVIWVDDPANPDPAAPQDPAASRTFHLEPPVGGSWMLVCTFYPEGWEPELTQEEIEKAQSRFDVGDAFDDDDNPEMHTTHTIDYGIVLSGEIDHIKPVSLGGTDDLRNLQPLHWRNNRYKGDNYPDWDCVATE